MYNTKNVLGRLRALREEKDIRQEYMARRLGIDRTTYVRKERGAIPITTAEWLKLADVMKEDPSSFFTFSPSVAPGTAMVNERLLVKLYRSLSQDEKNDFVSTLRLMLKGVRRKTVKDTLEMLREA
ncbi:MAG: helix-turn-helix domain-containing protein [Deltaproteobacteria bacterium]|nr:helix-turn-helix domain-containing protein [Deltaproteobacteria bacterium]